MFDVAKGDVTYLGFAETTLIMLIQKQDALDVDMGIDVMIEGELPLPGIVIRLVRLIVRAVGCRLSLSIAQHFGR